MSKNKMKFNLVDEYNKLHFCNCNGIICFDNKPSWSLYTFQLSSKKKKNIKNKMKETTSSTVYLLLVLIEFC